MKNSKGAVGDDIFCHQLTDLQLAVIGFVTVVVIVGLFALVLGLTYIHSHADKVCPQVPQALQSACRSFANW